MEVDSAEALPDSLVEALERADEVAAMTPAAAVDCYMRIMQTEERSDEVGMRTKEEAVYRLACLYAQLLRFDDVMGLLTAASPFFAAIPKARTAKIVRTMLDLVAKVEGSLELQVSLCKQVIAWCTAEKRTFLRQRVESRYVSLLFEQTKYQEALQLVSRLLKELKKLDDKQLLVETHLVEARVHHALRNIPKAKAALTASRTAGQSIYVAPLLQSELDTVSGILHTEEGDFTTAYSYFLEAYEGYNAVGPSQKTMARASLKYMVLCLVLGNKADEVSVIIGGKAGIKYSGPELAAMDSIAKAARERSLEKFEAATTAHAAQLGADLLIKHKLEILYAQLLEANLSKIIEPYSVVELARVAELIMLPLPKVEKKLSQMILDGTLLGILDAGHGRLIIHEPSEQDMSYENSAKVVKNMGDVVDSLFRRAEGLFAQ